MRLIHDIYSMTVGLYSRLDETGNTGLLRKWYNPFPVKWFDTQSFFAAYMVAFGAKNKTRDNAYKLIAYNKILVLKSALETMRIIYTAQNNASLIQLIFKKSEKPYEGNLQFYKDYIANTIGIKINDFDGLARLETQIIKLSDRYIERYKDKKQTTESGTFIDLALSVFSLMGVPYAKDMSLYEFAKLKNLADKKISKSDGANK